VAPALPEELVLCEIVASLVGASRVGIQDDFFRLGGHSLLAVRLAMQVRARLARELPLHTIFEYPCLGDLASAIAITPRVQSDPPAIHADPANAHAPFPLTPVQQAYWFGRQGLLPLGEVACHLYEELRLSALDVERFTNAWRRSIARHPMLRAVITPDGEQIVLREVPDFTILFADFSPLPSHDAEIKLEAIRESMSHQRLDPARWPLFDVRATQMSQGDCRVHLSFDALILDGESIGVLLREVFASYGGSESPAPAIAFRDYVQSVQGDGDALARARAYWESRIDDLPPSPSLPLEIEPAALSDPRFSRRHARVPRDKWETLKRLATNHRLTASNVLLTAFAEVVATWATVDDFTLNLTVSNRPPSPEFDCVLGVFTTLTPLAVRAARTGAFVDRAQFQQAQLLRDLEHRAFSGVEVQRLIAQREGDAGAGILPVVFTSMVGDGESQLPSGVEDVAFAITQTPQTWLDNKVYDDDDGLGIDWDAPEALFPPGMLDAMFQAYVGLIGSLSEGDAAWIAPKRSLVPAEQCALFDAVNATGAPLPEDLLHTRVFATAAAMSGTTALVAPHATFTFDELDRCVRVLALRSLRTTSLSRSSWRRASNRCSGLSPYSNAAAHFCRSVRVSRTGVSRPFSNRPESAWFSLNHVSAGSGNGRPAFH
jgi:hypothetical protein